MRVAHLLFVYTINSVCLGSQELFILHIALVHIDTILSMMSAFARVLTRHSLIHKLLVIRTLEFPRCQAAALSERVGQR